jgi:hypothetical protein
MPIARAPICEKHKPRVYKDQCKQCQALEKTYGYEPNEEEEERHNPVKEEGEDERTTSKS